MIACRGNKVECHYDKNGNVVFSKEFAEWIFDELNRSIPTNWISMYRLEKELTEKEFEVVSNMVEDWRNMISEANNKVIEGISQRIKETL